MSFELSGNESELGGTDPASCLLHLAKSTVGERQRILAAAAPNPTMVAAAADRTATAADLAAAGSSGGGGSSEAT
uniref:Uncharacterized protein n=1 Tax=Oryza sativa subsp. japonica TaxID=39947 RepID=Q5VPX6_ORYSJ|nr:hypothetical protein [Oryza sativa Japonica Group]